MRAAYAAQVSHKASVMGEAALEPGYDGDTRLQRVGDSGADKSFLMCSYRQMNRKV